MGNRKIIYRPFRHQRQQADRGGREPRRGVVLLWKPSFVPWNRSRWFAWPSHHHNRCRWGVSRDDRQCPLDSKASQPQSSPILVACESWASARPWVAVKTRGWGQELGHRGRVGREAWLLQLEPRSKWEDPKATMSFSDPCYSEKALSLPLVVTSLMTE